MNLFIPTPMYFLNHGRGKMKFICEIKINKKLKEHAQHTLIEVFFLNQFPCSL